VTSETCPDKTHESLQATERTDVTVPCVVVNYAMVRLDQFLKDSLKVRPYDSDPGKLTAPHCVHL